MINMVFCLENWWRIIQWAMLSTDDHRRDSAGLTYVYPVVSRRAGGVSVGINLNPNNACNWACLYCQVEGLSRGGPPPLDLGKLRQEFSDFMGDLLHGDFMLKHVPEEARKLVDVAFSGNGEPTSAAEFEQAVECVIEVLDSFGLIGAVPIRVITNGSFMHRENVRRGIQRIGEMQGEIWFKFDRATADEIAEINSVPLDPAKAVRQLEVCAALAPTWVQTCWFALDGRSPGAASIDAYCRALQPLANSLKGIHLYGLARPSMQPGATRLTRLDPAEMEGVGALIQEKTGIRVTVSP